MKPPPSGNSARRVALQAAAITAAATLVLTILACRSIWISHMEEADRQLKAFVPSLTPGSDGRRPIEGFLSGEHAPLHLISLQNPSGFSLAEDPAWTEEDRAALEIGGRFKTRFVQMTPWRVMGIREDGWSLRLAMNTREVFAEVTAFAVKALILGGGAALAAGFAAHRYAARLSGRIVRLSHAISGIEGLPDEIPAEASDPPEITGLKSALRSNLSKTWLALESARRFGADAGHELRTPLAVIQSGVDAALERPFLPEQWPMFLESLLVQCRKLRVTLDSLQLLAHADSGTVTLNRQTISFDGLIRELLDDLSNETDSLNMAITVELAPIHLSGDPGLIRLAVWNLLINAVRHNYQQAGTISISLTKQDEADSALFTIANSGPPLAFDEHEAIFQRFHRGRTARQSGTPGQGLGLSLALACVQAHKGSLTLLHSDVRGTALQVTLPVV